MGKTTQFANRLRRRLGRALVLQVTALVAIPAALAGCSGSDDAKASGDGTTKVVVSVAYAGLEVFSPVDLAKHFGIFKKNGLDVEIKVVPTADMVALLQRGKIDVAAAGLSAGVLNAIDSGADLRYIAGGPAYPKESKQGYWLKKSLIPAGGIDKFDPCSLKGKLVSPGGAGIAGGAAMPLVEYLKKCNLKVSDLRISPLAGADAAAAIKSGALDLGMLSDPVWSDADQKGYGKLLIPFGTAQQTGYLAGAFRKKNPEAAKAFVRSIAEVSEKYLKGDYHKNAEVRKALIETMKLPAATLDAGIPLVFPVDAKFDAAAILGRLQQAWIEIGGILNYSKPLSDDGVIDNSLVEQVATK